MTFSKLTKRSSLALALSGSLVALSPIAQACTRALYAGTDDMVVTGRSMDWMEDIQTDLWASPRGMTRGRCGRPRLRKMDCEIRQHHRLGL